MKKNEEYLFFYKENKIVIKTGKKIDIGGEIIYYAYTDFKHLLALAECREKALENCVKRIKFAIQLSEKNIILMRQDQATTLAKKYFEENYINKTSIKDHYATLSYGVSVEDEILTLIVYNWEFCHSTDDSKPKIVAYIYVNLLTGECDMIENKDKLK